MNGIFLQGGGGKGAYQAGVISALSDLGIKMDVICGTSIGAVNGYFIYSGNEDKLEEYWMSLKTQVNVKTEDSTIDNSFLFDYIKKMDKIKNEKDFYINYTEVKGTRLKELSPNMRGRNKEDIIEKMVYTTLLPKRSGYEVTEEKMQDYDSRELFDMFKEDLKKGLYDGYHLDGGIINNEFMNPFLENKVDKLYIVSFIKDFRLPEYIYENYREDQIVDLSPNFKFEKYHMVTFDRDFVKEKFEYGYDYAKKTIQSLL
jgi:hypothetical protein